MKSFGLKYAVIILSTLFIFANFVACGSQFYQVSMKDDYEPSKAPPEASDPTSSLYGIHAQNGWQNLPINYRFGQNMNDSQKKYLINAMLSWEKAAGKTLFKLVGSHDGISGDSFSDLYSSLYDNINGHYLDDDWDKTAKPTVVLATTIWDNHSSDSSVIVASDIRFNNEHYVIGDSLSLTSTESKEVVDMQSLALHELGHLLGLAHVESEVDNYSIMNPHLFIGEGLTSRKLSRGDIERIQTIYGCEGDACDVDALATEFELGKHEGGTAH